ncbi:MAG: hypothetical protein V4689_19195 [Verrucomicrobiota bacterium]
MTTEPQTALDELSPKSFEIDSLAWWRRSGIWIVLIFAIVFGIFASPPYPRHRKNPYQVEAVNNARQIGIALIEFQDEFGQMPDAGTIDRVRQKSATDLNLGAKSSNDFFRQLLATGIVQSEPMFYAEISGTRKPDRIITGASALAKGECGFTYFTGATKDCNPSRPILVTPLIPGTDRFDPKPFDGKAVMLKADNSVTSLTIVKSTGRVMVNGKNLMDPTNPIWEGKPPMIAHPEF